MKTTALLIIISILCGCEKEMTEDLFPNDQDQEEQLFDFVCKEYHSFLFYNPAFQSLSSVGIAKTDTLYGVTDSYVLKLMTSVFTDTVICITDKYIIDLEAGILDHVNVTDGDTIGRKVHFLQCEKIEDFAENEY